MHKDLLLASAALTGT